MCSDLDDESYLDRDLPEDLENSLVQYKIGLKNYYEGNYNQIDLDWCNLFRDLNQA